MKRIQRQKQQIHTETIHLSDVITTIVHVTDVCQSLLMFVVRPISVRRN